MSTDPIENPYLFNGHMVPGIWRYLLPKDVHQFRVPKERRATCDDCPQSKFEGYDKTYRCCSYHPVVPNFLLGLALRQPISRKAVNNLFEKGFVIPEGFSRTPHQWVDYLADLSDGDFGGAKRVKCPNLNQKNGYCNIYAFRNGVCSTFFCINDHGTHGEKFWEDLQEMVSQMEFALSQWALAEQGFDVEAYFKRMDALAPTIKDVAQENHGWSEETRDYLWGKFAGREFETIRKCGDLIADNRDRLWEIANGWKIVEADDFDQAMNKMVPKEYAHEIDPSDLDGGESASVSDIYSDLKQRYRTLWRVPSELVLSPRAKITKNPKDDVEAKHYRRRPYMLEFYSREKGKSVEWREYLTEKHVKALKLFKSKKSVTDRLLKNPTFKGMGDPMDFLAENVGKKVLQKPRPQA